MDATRASETLIYDNPTRRNIPGDGILHSHSRENLKSYINHEKVLILFRITERKKLKKNSHKQGTRNREKETYEHNRKMKERALTKNEEQKIEHLNRNRTILWLHLRGFHYYHYYSRCWFVLCWLVSGDRDWPYRLGQ
jgi:glucan phosphoethanolaminetransferase (alkaline phosphatase superfamily)